MQDGKEKANRLFDNFSFLKILLKGFDKFDKLGKLGIVT